MSFKADLERWAASQIGKISDPKRLGINIRRLLHGADVSDLAPIDRSGFPSEIRESRPGEFASTTPRPWGLESGLFAWSAPPVYPMLVNIGADLSNYFSSIGTNVHCSGRNEYLVGPAYEDGTCIDWPDNPPTVTNSTYQSTIYPKETPSDDNPSEYTGLMRLAVQSKIGSGNPVLGLAASSGAKHGLIYDSNYFFWRIEIDSNGVVARKLENDSRTDSLRQALASGTVSYETADFYLAWILATVSEAVPIQDIVLLDAAAISPVYAAGREPMSHGWAFSRDGSECAIVTFKEGTGADETDWFWESSLYSVSFTWNPDNTPSATLNILESNKKFSFGTPSNLFLWRYLGGQSCLLVPPHPSVVVGTTDSAAPLYVCYDSSNARNVLRVSQIGDLGPISESCIPMRFCGRGAGTSSRDVHQSTVSGGGFAFGNVDLTKHYSSASKVHNELTVSISSVGEYGDYVAHLAGEGGCGLDNAEMQAWELATDPDPDPVTECSSYGVYRKFQTGSQDWTRVNETRQEVFFAQAAILTDDPEAIYLGKSEYGDATFREKKTGDYSGIREYLEKGVWQCKWDDAVLGPSYTSPATTKTYGNCSQWDEFEFSPWRGQPTNENTHTFPADGEYDNSPMYFITPHDDIVVSRNYTDWQQAYLKPGGTNCASKLAEVRLSYNGYSIHDIAIGTPDINGGYPDVANEDNKKWAGLA